MTEFRMTEYGERYPPSEYRAIVVKDNPKAWLRPWHWTVEEFRSGEWSLIREGRSVSRRGAWRRVHVAACALSHRTDREEACILSTSGLVKSRPDPPKPSPLEPEFLP